MTRKQNFKKVTIGQNRKENTNKDYFFFNFFYDFDKNLKSIFCRYMSIVHMLKISSKSIAASCKWSNTMKYRFLF